MKPPLYQQVFTWVAYILIGFTFLGNIAGIINDAKTLITPQVTFIGSAIILIFWVGAEIVSKFYRLRWSTENNSQIRIKKIGVKPRLAILGAISLLWLPVLIGSSKEEQNVKTPPTIIPSDTGQLEVYFSVKQDIISQGGDCTILEWDIENAEKIYLEGGDIVREGISGHDSRQVCPATTTTYVLNVEANGENYEFKKTVAVKSELPSGKIAFTSDRAEQGYRIFAFNIADGKTTQITYGANRDSLPVDDWDPSWSSDGEHIVFESGKEGEFDIFTISHSVNELQRLTTDSTRNLAPVWSPDDSCIAFQSVRSTNFDIYLMKSDGSEVRRLTNHSGPDMWPSWSPDGKQIVFEAQRNENGKSGLYILDIANKDVKSLLVDEWNNGQPAWSENGKIAFYSDRDGNKEIYTIDEDGSNLTRITDNESEDWFPAWSPDGKWIAFTSSRDDNLEIYVTDSEGQHLLRITNQESQDRDPSWVDG